MTALAAIAFALTLGGVVALVQRGGRHVYNYAVTDDALSVRLFGRVCVYRIALADIADARLWRVSWPTISGVFTTLRLGNRVLGPAIVVTRRHGFPRAIIITPDDPHAMLARLRSHEREIYQR